MNSLPELNDRLDRLVMYREDLCYELIEANKYRKEEIELELDQLEEEIDDVEFEIDGLKNTYGELNAARKG